MSPLLVRAARTGPITALGLMASVFIATPHEVAHRSTESEAATDGRAPPYSAGATAAMRALIADPGMRKSAGLSENAYDFNAPNGVPGFGPIDAADRRFTSIAE